MDPLFRVHRLNEAGLSKAEKLANCFTQLVESIDEIVPGGSREKLLAREHLELASFYSKKAMASLPGNQAHTVMDQPAPGRHPVGP